MRWAFDSPSWVLVFVAVAKQNNSTKKTLLFHLVNHKYNPTICLIRAEIQSSSMPAQPTYYSSLSRVFLTYWVSLSNISQDTSRFDCPAHPIPPTGHTQFIQLTLSFGLQHNPQQYSLVQVLHSSLCWMNILPRQLMQFHRSAMTVDVRDFCILFLLF